MKRLAIIPARSGSKGLRDKNVLAIRGKPLLAYAIESATDSGLFDRVIVSTDSPRYAEISRACGAEVMMRSQELSGDNVCSFMVICDVLERVGESYDYFMLLQPTSPLRRAHHVREAVRLFEAQTERYDFLVSVTRAPHAALLVHPLDNGSLRWFDADFSTYRRQRATEYVPNGAIFIGKPEAYLSQKHFFGARSLAYVMTKRDSVDVDDEIDFKLATVLIQEEEHGTS